MQNMPISGETGQLQELHRWLTWSGGSMTFGGTALILPMGIVVSALTWAAILFTPFLLWKLYQVQKTGWIIGFLVMVGGPLALSFFAEKVSVLGIILATMPILMFYLYTWTLRHYVGEWIEEIRWSKYDELQLRGQG